MAHEGQLSVQTNCFSFKGQEFKYSDVVSVYFFRVRTKKSFNFRAAGTDDNAEMRIYVRGRSKPLVIKSGPQWVSLYGPSFGGASTEVLASKYERLARMSFQVRLGYYTHSLKQFGYFQYSGCRIFADGDVDGPRWRFSLTKNKPIMRQPFAIFYDDKGAGFFGGNKRREIETTYDADVFFFLLDRLFALRWTRRS